MPIYRPENVLPRRQRIRSRDTAAVRGDRLLPDDADCNVPGMKLRRNANVATPHPAPSRYRATKMAVAAAPATAIHISHEVRFSPGVR